MKIKRVAATVTVVANIALLTPIVVDAADTQLPMSCSAGVCGANIPFVQSGQASAITAGNTLRIQQDTERAILNWKSFDIGADGRVVFNQPGASSVALNRIFQNSPSKIFGTLEANGQVYLVNQNGFVFGAGSRVKTAGLLASTLNISDATFKDGLLAPGLQERAALESDGRIGELGEDGFPIYIDGEPVRIKIAVEEGAEITTTGSGSRILLAAQNIDNAGKISAPDGQVVLAAGEKVYLEASTNPGLRGLLVEVDGGGEAWNRLTGDISSARGNVTVTGLAVNQQGRISATTTVAANGSIRLLARDSHALTSTIPRFVSTRTGNVELGADSVTSVLPELQDTATAVDDQTQLKSSVEIVGRQVTLRGGSRIVAPSGNVSVSALRSQRDAGIDAYDEESRIRMEGGAIIDVSGSTATLPINRNLVTVELRANELRDTPLQRDGALRGETIVVDARIGTQFADVSGALAAVPKDIAERTSTGGSAVFNSEGGIVVDPGANIDVSGGRIDYAGGMIQTTQLIGADGSMVDISLADPNKVYVAAINPTYVRRYDRWGVEEVIKGPAIGRYEQGYVEGRNAGTLQFAAPALLLSGSFDGSVVSGPYQRDPSRTPMGGRFIIGLEDGRSAQAAQDHRAPSINITNTPSPIVVGDRGILPRTMTLDLCPSLLLDGGFAEREIYSNGNVTLEANTPLNLAAGSSLRIVAQSVDVKSDITAPGGTISLGSQTTAEIDGVNLPRAGVRIADGLTLNVSGTWTNDVADSSPLRPPLTNVAYLNGGTIELDASGIPLASGAAAELVLGNGSQFIANGGGWLEASGTIDPGSGGSIAFSAPEENGAFQIGRDIQLQAYGVSGARGGTFALTAGRVEIGSGSSWAGEQRFDPAAVGEANDMPDDAEKLPSVLRLGDSLFADHGFSNFDLTATGRRESEDVADVFTVRTGAVVDTRTSSLQLLGLPQDHATGNSVLDFGQVVLEPEIDRAASSVRMSVAPTYPSSSLPIGGLHVEEGTTIRGDAGSSFVFSGPGGVRLDGAIYAPGGTVQAEVPTPSEVALDMGFLADLQIEIGANAVIDTAGTTLLRPNDTGLLIGEALAGGSIKLLANRGSINVRSGALLDISGTSTALDFANADETTYTRQAVGTAGGTLQLRAPESIVLDGTIAAHAGTGERGAAPGGSLSLELTRDNGFALPNSAPLANSFSATPRVIRVVDHAVTGEPEALNGLAYLELDRLRGSGIDALSLVASDQQGRNGGGRIEFDAGIDLSMPRGLSIDSPVVSVRGDGEVNLAASQVALGFGNRTDRGAQNVAGNGVLNVRGELIEFFGASDLTDIASANFYSTGDIRVRSIDSGTELLPGALRVAGDLTLSAQRIYPATGSKFTLSANGGENDVVRILQAGSSPGVPLSAAGSLRINAREIVQGGTILAPFGSIELNATESLTLADGSLTSVSAQGAVLPFGRVQIGSEWRYQLGSVSLTQDAIPERSVELSAPEVNMSETSTVDISGGGDLYAYEWIPGTGGSKDALDPLQSPGLYAIMPGLRDQFAPYDPQEFAQSDLTPGDSIYLSGIEGLEPGFYPLLPARYALLPGAYLVNALPGTGDYHPGETTTLPNGATVVAGYRTFGNTGLGDTNYSGFAIQPGSHARQLAAYEDNFASNFFPARAARLELDRAAIPADAGTLALNPGVKLDARGRVLTSAATGGQGATVNVAAQNLEIIGATATADSDAVQLSSSVLNSWNPSRLVLGGRRESAGDSVEVLADSVSVTDGAALALDEILIVARDEIRVDEGAHISARATGADGLDAVGLSLTGNGAADAAVLAVSDISRFTVKRPASAGVGAGRVNIDQGAQLSSPGSLLVDAPGGATLAGVLSGDDAAWDLVSRRIAFGETLISDGITVNRQLAGQLEKAFAVRLASSGAIEFLESTQLGGSQGANFNLDKLTLSAAVVRAAAADVDVHLGARQINLQGIAQHDAQAAVGGSGSLTLAAQSILLEEGVLPINAAVPPTEHGVLLAEGFSNVNLVAQGDIVGSDAATFRTSGSLMLSAARVTAASGADTRFESAQAVVINGSDTPDAPRSALALGGGITIAGASIEHNGTIALPSGVLELRADNGIIFGDGAVVDVSGANVTAGGRQVSSWGGTVSLDAGGDVYTAAGSSFLLNGAGDQDAGRLRIISGGSATIASHLEAHADDDAHGGSFTLAAGQLQDFAELNRALESGGFNERRAIRVNTGDLSLDAGSTITARFVNLTADNGTVRVAGSINALSGNERSSIDLFGGSDVVLESGASLRADGIGEESRGGIITLGARDGEIDLHAGSSISADGTAQDGRLLVRAAARGNDVAVGEWSADFQNLESITVEPVMTFSNVPDSLTSVDFDTYRTAADAYFAGAAPNIAQRLTVPEGIAFYVQQGIDIQRDGDLEIGAFDLSSWRFGDQPGALTVRASGSISVTGSVSDGFEILDDGKSTERIGLLAGRSSTIRMTAGSALDSADFGAVGANREAKLSISSVIRTGTGDLLLNAAGDIEFVGPDAAVYTGGLAGSPTQVRSRGASTSFITGGGQLALGAGRDIIGTAVAQSSSEWQPRQGRDGATPLPTQWGVDLKQFDWNAGTLGGGDVSIVAGNDVRDLSAAAADSAIEATSNVLTQFTGGVLSLDAGGDVATSMFHVTHGDNRLRSDGAFNTSRTGDAGTGVGSLLSIQDASASITSRQSIELESAFNPTLLVQLGVPPAQVSRFSTHTDRSSLRLMSAAGDVALNPSRGDLAVLIGDSVVNANGEGFDFGGLALLPANASFRSLTQDVLLGGDVILMSPSDHGQLDIFAARDVISQTSLDMSDASVVSSPLSVVPGSPIEALQQSMSGRHVDDDQPVLISAGRSIIGGSYEMPKAVRMTAGKDIINTTLLAQNLRRDDLTLVSAGRDLRYTLDPAATQAQIQVAGPGRVDVIAGRDVDLGFSRGLSTVGRLLNPNLATDDGADLTVLAGMGTRGLNADKFLAEVVEKRDDNRDALIKFVGETTGEAPDSYDAAVEAFGLLDDETQRPFLLDVFYRELVASGREANSDPELGFTRGFSAIDALLPGSRPADSTSPPNPYDGDVKLAFSRIYTIAGGAISLLAPGGLVNVGLANPPVDLGIVRGPSELGIVAQKAGDVRVFADGDVLVNQSRVFTLGGGNIAVWSTTGDIDAGRGSKTAISAPPPAVLVDASGTVTLDFGGAVAGSGIRTILTGSATEPGDVDLIAPAGIVNAGDAGIGASGNLNVAAQTVVGLDNIQVDGSSTGVPSETSNLGASLSGVSNAASSAANASGAAIDESPSPDSAQASLADSALSWLEVFVVGLGEEQSDPKDMESQKRQQ